MSGKTKQKTECELSLERLNQWFEASKKSSGSKMKDNSDASVEWLKNIFGMNKEEK